MLPLDCRISLDVLFGSASSFRETMSSTVTGRLMINALTTASGFALSSSFGLLTLRRQSCQSWSQIVVTVSWSSYVIQYMYCRNLLYYSASEILRRWRLASVHQQLMKTDHGRLQKTYCLSRAPIIISRSDDRRKIVRQDHPARSPKSNILQPGPAW